MVNGVMVLVIAVAVLAAMWLIVLYGSSFFGPYTTYPNMSPAVVYFDLSLGYQTGEKPANATVLFELVVRGKSVWKSVPRLVNSVWVARLLESKYRRTLGELEEWNEAI